jgi:hypothetical protein
VMVFSVGVMKGGPMIGLLFAAAVLVLDILSLLDVFNGGRDVEKKALWVVVILMLPLAGPILYYLIARRGPLTRVG